jgi:replicative DNA helicase
MDDTPAGLSAQVLEIVAGLATVAHHADGDEQALRARIREAIEALSPLTQRDDDSHAVCPIVALTEALLADVEQRRRAAAQHGGVVGMRTGLDHLDETINGLEAGKLYLMAAMPGTGKTTLCLQWAGTIAQAGYPALYISLENDALDLARKTACRLGHVSYTAVLKGRVPAEQWACGVSQVRQKLQGRLYVSSPRATMPDPARLLATLADRAGQAPRLLVLDYLQAFVKRSTPDRDLCELRERIDRWLPVLRSLGEEYGCAVLAISSQNRQGLTGRPIDLLVDGDHCVVTEEQATL